MAEFIRYTRQNGASTATVFVNVAHLNSAVYDQQTGELTITTGQGHSEVISGQQAKEAIAVLNRFAAQK